MSDILQKQYTKIYNFCYFRVKNKEIAEDLTQETFLKYFSQISYIEKGKPLAYLYTIARNNCIDFHKSKSTGELDDNLSTDKQGEIDTNIAVHEALNTLNFELQEILLLRFNNELTVTEIGKYLGISRFAVHRKIKTALNLLKKELKKEDFYE